MRPFSFSTFSPIITCELVNGMTKLQSMCKEVRCTTTKKSLGQIKIWTYYYLNFLNFKLEIGGKMNSRGKKKKRKTGK